MTTVCIIIALATAVAAVNILAVRWENRPQRIGK